MKSVARCATGICVRNSGRRGRGNWLRGEVAGWRRAGAAAERARGAAEARRIFCLRLGGARSGDRIGGRRLFGLLAPRGIDLIAHDIGEAGERADDEHGGDPEREQCANRRTSAGGAARIAAADARSAGPCGRLPPRDGTRVALVRHVRNGLDRVRRSLVLDAPRAHGRALAPIVCSAAAPASRACSARAPRSRGGR